MTKITMTKNAGIDPGSSSYRNHEQPEKPNSVENVRENYDRIAEEYTRHLVDELRFKPLDCELLTRFADEVKGRGLACDMGCGPGQVARFLHHAGANVFGLDLSPQMIEQARRVSPDLEFRTGNMLALDLPDGSLAGISAFYAIVNIPMDRMPAVFAEMFRVLAPYGLLLLAFHIGDEVLRPPELWGQPVAMDFYHLPLGSIRALLAEAGFEIVEVVERDPYPDVEFQSRRAYIFARKPDLPDAA
jgi:ubiquinone/menaquinone biosynthesis C-methylase UbiE